jgi:hypothetical protein
MPDGLTIEVDATSLLTALDALGDAAEAPLMGAAHETALAIQQEARGRVARRTGRTATGITVEETHDGRGYIVTPFSETHRRALKASGNAEQPRNLPWWLEHGTRSMSPRPYLSISAQLEQGAHLRRVERAMQDAINEVSR